MAAQVLSVVPTIPVELRERKQWVVWKLDFRDGDEKPTKIPFNPANNKHASTTNPQTWGTYLQALAASKSPRQDYQGIGYVFSKDDPYTGVDLDGCRNPTTGEIGEMGQGFASMLSSYTEVSPSRAGLHIIVKGKLPGKGHKDRANGIEIYDSGRYFTITGDVLPEFPSAIEERQTAITNLYNHFFAKEEEPVVTAERPRQPLTLDDQQVIEKASNAINGVRFAALWRGDRTMHLGKDGKPDHSASDLAFCNALAFYTHDEYRTDALFRKSGLMRPKWDEMHGTMTYGAMTIEKAFHGRTEFYGSRAPQPLYAPSSASTDEDGYETDDEPQAEEGNFYHLYSDIEVQNLPPMRWIIDRIIAEESLVSVFGHSGTGKSFFMMDLCLHVTLGWPWQGREVTQGPVVYIAAEGKRGIQLRLKAWKIHHGVPLQRSLPIYIIGEAVPLLKQDCLGKLIATLKRLSPAPVMVVVDTLGRSFAGGEENSNDSMNEACNAANLIQREIGCSVFFVHHKGNSHNGMRGGTALFGGVDTAIDVSKEPESTHVSVSCSKQKDGAEPFAPMVLKLKQILSVDGFLSSCVLTGTQPEEFVDDVQGPPRQLLMALAKTNWVVGLTSTEWMTASGVPRSTYNDHRRVLVTQGYVLEPGAPERGARYVLSPKGRLWANHVRRMYAEQRPDD